MIKYNIGDFIIFMVDEFVTNMQSHTFKQFCKIQCKNRNLLNEDMAMQWSKCLIQISCLQHFLS